MKYTKRALAVCMSVIFAVGLAGCGKKTEDTANVVYQFGDCDVTYGEYYIYGKTVEEDYQKTYGNGVWEKEGIDNIRKKENELMWRFYNGVKDVPGVKVYGDYSQKERCAIVTLNIGDYDSSEVSDELLMEYDISTRSGGHCAPLMHEALGTVEQGAVRFSFSHYNTEEEVDTAIRAIRELAEEP